MIQSSLLQNPAIQAWLGGIVPIWTMLDPADFRALLFPPLPDQGPIRLATDLTPEEIALSPVPRNVAMVVRAASEGSGLKMTAGGNLSRADVARFCETLDFSNFDIAAFRRNYGNALNEDHVAPLYFARHVAMAMGLLRRYKGHFRATKAGQRAQAGAEHRALLAKTFFTAFWRIDLSYFGNDALGFWPQSEAGLVLWCLSFAAAEWRPYAELARLCAIPPRDLLERSYDFPSSAMLRRILHPLEQFGLLEHRTAPPGPDDPYEHRVYRKTPLFDRFLSFDIQPAGTGTTRH